jgi:spermidine synthase
LIGLLCTAAFLPILVNDARLLRAHWAGPMVPGSAILLLLSICPFCTVLGYLTPCLIDRYAEGDPSAAGKAYALNVLGCILGPVVASYLLMPWLSERHGLILLVTPFFVFYALMRKSLPKNWRWGIGLAAAIVAVWAVFISQSHEEQWLESQSHAEVRRDYAASVISFGEGLKKQLLVNGIGMTMLTPVTKYMVHLPLTFHKTKPESALIICFGMGTSYRSALSWNLKTTAVELVPSVAKAFGFYHADAASLAANHNGRVVVDDGRRFLSRTGEKFDIIVIDPPPPVEAAGSSLLYSVEFYELAKARLKPGGIVAAWLPGNTGATLEAVIRSLRESFAHVRCYNSIGKWGMHFLASMDMIEIPSVEALAARMPSKAREDLLEWSLSLTAADSLNEVLGDEVSIAKILGSDTSVRITDDRPFNEYFLMRDLMLFMRRP